MPQMQISRASRNGAPSIQGNKAIANAFTGNNVYIDPVLNAEGMSIANVTFMPGARTHWHTHEKGQILRVVTGSGWATSFGGVTWEEEVGDQEYAKKSG
ncbi:hypothetical protein KCU88_g5549, partial [Aureobasidium melanogenum]